VAHHRFVALLWRPYTWGRDKLLLSLSDRQLIEGFEVYVLPMGESSEDIFRKMRDGLALLRQRDARRFVRAQQDLARIIVQPWRSSYYMTRSNSCALDVVLVLRRPPEEIAKTVVHEAMHARIQCAGIPYVGDKLQNRIERVCTKAELDFLYRLSAAGYNVPPTRLEAMRSFVMTGNMPRLWQIGWRADAEEREAFFAHQQGSRLGGTGSN